MKWKTNIRIINSTLSLLGVLLFSINLSAMQTANPGNISSIKYDENGISFQLKQIDGSVVNHTEACTNADTFSLSITHANYQSAMGALIAAHASGSYITLVTDGCTGSNATVANVEIGTSPELGAPIPAGLMTSSIISGRGGYQEIINNMDLVNNETMVLSKSLTSARDWAVFDSQRGVGGVLKTNADESQSNIADSLTAYRVDGYITGGHELVNGISDEYFHLVLQSQAGFFDVVRYTGSGAAQNISHNLNHEVGMIWIKNISSSGDWVMWHKDFAANEYVLLNQRPQSGSSASVIPSPATTTSFSVGSGSQVNTSGSSYVAYVFANNPSNEIVAGTYTGSGSAGNKQTTGFKPRLLFFRNTSANSDSWLITQEMQPSDSGIWPKYLSLNENRALHSFGASMNVDADGFSFNGASVNFSGNKFVYLAIGEPE